MSPPRVIGSGLNFGEVPAALMDRLRRHAAQSAEIARNHSLTGLFNPSVLADTTRYRSKDVR